MNNTKHKGSIIKDILNPPKDTMLNPVVVLDWYSNPQTQALLSAKEKDKQIRKAFMPNQANQAMNELVITSIFAIGLRAYFKTRGIQHFWVRNLVLDQKNIMVDTSVIYIKDQRTIDRFTEITEFGGQDPNRQTLEDILSLKLQRSAQNKKPYPGNTNILTYAYKQGYTVDMQAVQKWVQVNIKGLPKYRVFLLLRYQFPKFVLSEISDPSRGHVQFHLWNEVEDIRQSGQGDAAKIRGLSRKQRNRLLRDYLV